MERRESVVCCLGVRRIRDEDELPGNVRRANCCSEIEKFATMVVSVGDAQCTGMVSEESTSGNVREG